jgi:hypothetical protein
MSDWRIQRRTDSTEMSKSAASHLEQRQITAASHRDDVTFEPGRELLGHGDILPARDYRA